MQHIFFKICSSDFAFLSPCEVQKPLSSAVAAASFIYRNSVSCFFVLALGKAKFVLKKKNESGGFMDSAPTINQAVMLIT